MRNTITILFFLSFLILASCKSSYELLLEGNDVDLKYKTAFELFNAKKYSKAAAMFDALKLATNGTLQDDTVQYYSALSNFRLGDMQTAETAFESFNNTFPRSPFIETSKFLYLECLYNETYRYELDQTPTYKALAMIYEYVADNPDNEYTLRCKEMITDMEERLDRKEYEGAKLYYTTEDYRAAHYALKNVLKEDAETIFREQIMYYIVMSSYKYALNSIPERQKERYMAFTDDYYNFVSEYPDSNYRKELDNLSRKVQAILKK